MSIIVVVTSVPQAPSLKNMTPCAIVGYIPEDCMEFDMDNFVMEHYSDSKGNNKYSVESRHDRTSKCLYKQFLVFFLNLEDVKYKPLQMSVPGVLGKTLVRFIVECTGHVTASKIAMVNDIMCQYIMSPCKRRCNSSLDSPYLQPSTTNRMLSQLFAHLGMYQEWEYKIRQHFNFTGGLARMITYIYSDRSIFIQVSLIYVIYYIQAQG